MKKFIMILAWGLIAPALFAQNKPLIELDYLPTDSIVPKDIVPIVHGQPPLYYQTSKGAMDSAGAKIGLPCVTCEKFCFNPDSCIYYTIIDNLIINDGANCASSNIGIGTSTPVSYFTLEYPNAPSSVIGILMGNLTAIGAGDSFLLIGNVLNGAGMDYCAQPGNEFVELTDTDNTFIKLQYHNIQLFGQDSVLIDGESNTPGSIIFNSQSEYPVGDTTKGNVLTSNGGGQMVWKPLSLNGWSLTGNRVNDSLQYLGTQDSSIFELRTDNIVSGYIAPNNSFRGKGNTAFGYQSMGNDQQYDWKDMSSGNCAFGYGTMSAAGQGFSNLTGYGGNTAMGFNAMNKLDSAAGCVAIGANTCGDNFFKGYYCVVVGTGAMRSSVEPFGSIAIGGNASGNIHNQNAQLNTVVGFDADTGTGGSFNTSIGAFAGAKATQNAENNVAVGNGALLTNVKGRYNTAIGSGADVGNDSLVNTTALGYGAVVTASNSAVIGNGQNVGIGISAPRSLLHVSGGDVYIDNSANGVILTAPNSSCYRITVTNSGTLLISLITCP